MKYVKRKYSHKKDKNNKQKNQNNRKTKQNNRVTKQKLDNIKYKKNKGIVKFVNYNIKQNLGQPRQYHMLCKLTGPKLDYINKNPHTAHFFCNYNNVIFCNTQSEKDNCNSQLGIKYSRTFRPDPFRGKDPYLDYIIQNDDLIHHIKRKTNIEMIDLDWINLYEVLCQVIISKIKKMNMITFYGINNSIEYFMNKHFNDKVWSNSQIIETSHFIHINLNKDKYTFNRILEILNTMMIDSTIIIELSIPIRNNMEAVMYLLYSQFKDMKIYSSTYQSHQSTFYVIATKDKIIEPIDINKIENIKYPTHFVHQFGNAYKEIGIKQKQYTDRLLFYIRNLEHLPWQHIYNLRNMMETKKKDWLKQNPI